MRCSNSDEPAISAGYCESLAQDLEIKLSLHLQSNIAHADVAQLSLRAQLHFDVARHAANADIQPDVPV